MAKTQLTLEVLDFIKKTGMAEYKFGELALGDPMFVLELKRGRRCWPETEAKVRKFMKKFAAKAA